MDSLEILALKNIIRLGQIAFSKHEEIVKWRDPPIDSVTKTHLSLDLKQALESQREWANALIDNSEEAKHD